MSIPGLFVTGTDTGVGKTRIAVAILEALKATGHRPGAMKPIASSGVLDASGRMTSPDAEMLAACLRHGSEEAEVCPICLPGDLAPSVAAALVGEVVHFDFVIGKVWEAMACWAGNADVMVVEGVGGFLCPITMDATVADLAVALDYPLIVVARRGLGTLNHTLLTVEAARTRGLRVAGVVLNGSEPTSNRLAEETNPRELGTRLGDVPILAELPHESGEAARSPVVDVVDWWELAKPSRMAPSSPARERETAPHGRTI